MGSMHATDYTKKWLLLGSISYDLPLKHKNRFVVSRMTQTPLSLFHVSLRVIPKQLLVERTFCISLYILVNYETVSLVV
jgi:hypothetical protein